MDLISGILKTFHQKSRLAPRAPARGRGGGEQTGGRRAGGRAGTNRAQFT